MSIMEVAIADLIKVPYHKIFLLSYYFPLYNEPKYI
jgi:hypothetical protein